MMRLPFGAPLAIVAALSFAVTVPAWAQSARFGGPGWEIGGFAGVLDDNPEFEPSRRAFRLAHEGFLGARVARWLVSDFFLEAELLYSPMDFAFRDETGRRHHNLGALFFSGGVGYNLDPLPRFQVFGRAGLGGGVRWRGAGDCVIRGDGPDDLQCHVHRNGRQPRSHDVDDRHRDIL